MRFEVKSGGITAIVFAMTLLSGAVFVMGLLAGYDVGRQAQLDAAQLATSYPVQSAPSPEVAPNPSPAESTKPATQSAALSPAPPATAPATSSVGAEGSVAGDSADAKHKLSKPSAAPTRRRLASSSIPSRAAPSSSPAAASPATEEDIGAAESENAGAGDELSRAPGNPDLQSRRAEASAAPTARHKPYNIQIQAAMDISGADKMIARLQKLGYRSHLVPTEIAGQRWYKVEVGPYATAEEAAGAETQLRQRYDATYSGAGRDNTPGEANAGDNYEE